eukprot:SAG11_NODE_1451_length_4880_cov_3.477724_5_plen_174_part_00
MLPFAGSRVACTSNAHDVTIVAGRGAQRMGVAGSFCAGPPITARRTCTALCEAALFSLPTSGADAALFAEGRARPPGRNRRGGSERPGRANTDSLLRRGRRTETRPRLKREPRNSSAVALQCTADGKSTVRGRAGGGGRQQRGVGVPSSSSKTSFPLCCGWKRDAQHFIYFGQ